MIADFAEYRANYEFSSGGLASAQRLDVKLRAAGRRPASSGAPLAAHPIMPVQVARRRANSSRRSRLGRRESEGGPSISTPSWAAGRSGTHRVTQTFVQTLRNSGPA